MERVLFGPFLGDKELFVSGHGSSVPPLGSSRLINQEYCFFSVFNEAQRLAWSDPQFRLICLPRCVLLSHSLAPSNCLSQ